MCSFELETFSFFFFPLFFSFFLKLIRSRYANLVDFAPDIFLHVVSELTLKISFRHLFLLLLLLLLLLSLSLSLSLSSFLPGALCRMDDA